MDAFLRRVIEQREAETQARWSHGRLNDLPVLPEDKKPEPRVKVGRKPDPVLELFRFHSTLDNTTVAECVGISRDAADARLSRLYRAGKIERVTTGVYRRVHDDA